MKEWEKDTKLSSFTKDAIVPTEPTPLQTVSREGSTGGLTARYTQKSVDYSLQQPTENEIFFFYPVDNCSKSHVAKEEMQQKCWTYTQEIMSLYRTIREDTAGRE